MEMEPLILEWSNKILDHLLELKKTKFPDLTFWLRKQDSERLRKGYWFQGSHYIFLGFSNKGDANNKTRQIGLVYNFWNVDNPTIYLEIVFHTETDKAIINCYKKIIEKLGGFEEVAPTKFYKNFSTKDFIKVLDEFLINEWSVIKTTIAEFDVVDELIIPEDKFQNLLERTLRVRANKDTELPKDIAFEPDDETNYWWLNANPKIWSISNHNTGQKQSYTTHNEKGNKRRIYKHFDATFFRFHTPPLF